MCFSLRSMSSVSIECSSSDDQFDRLPDSVLLLIFKKVGDVKALGRCCVVSKRIHELVPQVDTVLVRVDSVISDDESSPSSLHSSSDKSHSPSFFRFLFRGFIKPFHALGVLLGVHRDRLISDPLNEDASSCCVTHHSPSQVLKNFSEIKSVRIELPSGELGIEEGALLKWRATFGSTLDSCVILGASSMSTIPDTFSASESDNGSIPESFYTNGGLKMRVVWTISSLIAASARHYLLQPIISEHVSLESLILADVDEQGVLCMNKEQLEELRVKPLSASSLSKRTLVPALNIRLWYAPTLRLEDGIVMKGATLVAIRPSESMDVSDSLSWVASAFEEPYGNAARMLVKRRTYCLEMNSF